MAQQSYVSRGFMLNLALTYAWYRMRELYQWYRSAYVTVRTRSGPVRGVQVQAPDDNIAQASAGKYTQFIGIPYARPPVGALRFCDPQPIDPWTETLNATRESKACQRDLFTNRGCGQEDCLHLSIYTKQLRSDAERASASDAGEPTKVPVMVFFHGGAFMFGSNNKELYNPEYLLRRDILLVTVNYRLGALGFLSVDNPSAQCPGNAGLKDQVLAMRWIRENIAAFGGDERNVTIFGESAGGCSVHYHLLSPMSRGLFDKAIAMSGAVLTSWAICPLQDQPRRLARELGWNGDGGVTEMMRVLRSVSAGRLQTAQENIHDNVEKRQYMHFTFGPKIEPYVSEQCFIGEHPDRMCASVDTWSRSVPVIFSACSNEALLIHKATLRQPRLIDNLEQRFQDMVPLDLIGGSADARDSERALRVAAEFRRFYFGEARINIGQLDLFEQMMSDKLFLHGIHRAMQSRLRTSDAPTWYLRFDCDSKVLNMAKFMFAGKNVKGTCHADDCNYLFKTCIHPRLKQQSPEVVAIERFVDLWTEFARTGNPNGRPSTTQVNWEPICGNGPIKCLNLSAELSTVDMPEWPRMRFWDSLYEKQQQNDKSGQLSSAL